MKDRIWLSLIFLQTRLVGVVVLLASSLLYERAEYSQWSVLTTLFLLLFTVDSLVSFWLLWRVFDTANLNVTSKMELFTGNLFVVSVFLFFMGAVPESTGYICFLIQPMVGLFLIAMRYSAVARDVKSTSRLTSDKEDFAENELTS